MGRRHLAFLLLMPAVLAAAPRHTAPAGEKTREKLISAERDRVAREADSAQAARAALTAQREADAVAGQRVRAADALRRIEGAVLASAERLQDAARDQQHAEAALAQRQADFSKLLPLVLRLSRFPAETVLAVPGPPSQALEGLLIARGLAAELNRQAGALKEAREDAARLRREVTLRQEVLGQERIRQEAAASSLDQALEAARGQAAQTQDEAARAARDAAVLAAQAKTLRGALAAMDAAEAARARAKPEPAAPAGPLAAPVAGRILKAWGSAAEDGPATGVTLATAPGAYVSSPCAGRVAFAAPFRSYGQLLIVACRGGRDFVLAGLARLDAAVGQSVRAGEPVGRMAGEAPSLYVELRQNGKAIDPAPFLNTKG